MSVLDLIAPRATPTTSSRCSSAWRRARRRRSGSNSRRSAPTAATFDAIMEFTAGHLRRRALPADRVPPADRRRELAKELDTLRQRDLVTELFNRQHFLSRARAARSARRPTARTEQALLLIEPDNYKRLLDTIGLATPTDLLGDMANLLRRHLGESRRGRALRRPHLRACCCAAHDRRARRQLGRDAAQGLRRTHLRSRQALGHADRQHRRRADRREDRQRGRSAGQGQPVPARRRRAWAATASRSSTRPPSDRAEEERIAAWVRADPGRARRATTSCCTTSRSSACTAPTARSTKSCCA